MCVHLVISPQGQLTISRFSTYGQRSYRTDSRRVQAFTGNKRTKIHPSILRFANQKHDEVILSAPKERGVCEFYRTKYLLEKNQFCIPAPGLVRGPNCQMSGGLDDITFPSWGHSEGLIHVLRKAMMHSKHTGFKSLSSHFVLQSHIRSALERALSGCLANCGRVESGSPSAPERLLRFCSVLFHQNKERGRAGFSKEELETCMVNQVGEVGPFSLGGSCHSPSDRR